MIQHKQIFNYVHMQIFKKQLPDMDQIHILIYNKMQNLIEIVIEDFMEILLKLLNFVFYSNTALSMNEYKNLHTIFELIVVRNLLLVLIQV